MSKLNINFNGTSYEFDEAALTSASADIKSHLSSVMNGEGATIDFDGATYNIDSTKLSNATSAFAAYLGTIAGNGAKIKVGGVEYSVDSTKLSGAISSLETAFSALSGEVPADETLEGSGSEYYTLAPTALSFRSTEPLAEFQEVQVNGQTVDPSNYTLEEGSTIVKLSIDYLKTLDKGNYEVAIVSQNKTVKGEFSVAAPQLNEYGFYYNQPYVGYVDYFEAHVVLLLCEDHTAFIHVYEADATEVDSYSFDGNTVVVATQDMGDLHFTVSDSGMGMYNIELATTLSLGSRFVVADADYIYKFNNWYYSVFSVIDRTKSSYGRIKANINGWEVNTISSGAFSGCTNLRTITIPSCIQYVLSNAFGECFNLDEVIFENCRVVLEGNVLPEDATCVIKHSHFKNDYVCDICKQCEHLHVEVRNVKEPTCTEEGYTGDTVCLDCGKTATKGEAIARLEHIDNDLDKKCDLCGTLMLGLFDKDDNIVALWDDLVNVYGMDVSKDYVSGDSAKSSKTSPYYVLTNNNNLSSGVKLNLVGVTHIGQFAFTGCNNLTSITIPEGVTSIGYGAFRNCTSLMSVTIPNGVTNINDQTFYECTSLTSVTIPDSVTSIGDYAFFNCTSLTSVVIGDSVTKIDSYAFGLCKSLNNITFNGTISNWNTIFKSLDWNRNVPATYVQCTDGTVAL